jgi:hypothetical protein
MEAMISQDVRRLCKSVAEEQDPSRIKALLDELLQVLEERHLLASLL